MELFYAKIDSKKHLILKKKNDCFKIGKSPIMQWSCDSHGSRMPIAGMKPAFWLMGRDLDFLVHPFNLIKGELEWNFL